MDISCVGKSYLTNGRKNLVLQNILCVPDITKNLVSVFKLAQDNHIYLEFHGYYCLIKDRATRETLLIGTLKDGLYHLESASVMTAEVEHSSSFKQQHMHKNKGTSSFILLGVTNLTNINVVVFKVVWHKRLGHPSSKILNSIVKNCKLPVNDGDEIDLCDACQLGKAHNFLFTNSQSQATESFDIIYSDLWGPAPICSTDGFRYYILFVDDFSRYTWIYPLK